MTSLLLGVDVGTSSSKGVLARPDGSVVASASRPHRMRLPRPGWAEMDADADWWGDVVALCRELLAHAAGDEVAGVCVSGIGPCLLLADADLRPVGPAVLYGVDARAEAEILELEERLGADAIVRRGGAALSSQAVGPKLLWWRRHRPGQWARARSWHGCSSYVVARLTGEVVMDHHTASQCDPFYDLGAGGWARDWAEDVLGHLPLPRLVWPGEVVGTVHAAAADATGLPAGTPVAAGTVDAWAEAFGAGVRRPGDVMLMYGSTAFCIQVVPSPCVAPPLWATTGVEPGSHTLSAGTSTAGSLTGWFQDLTGGVPFAELVREAASVPSGAEGLVVLPYFAGERTPHFDPRARGVVAGLTLRHGRGHLYRACLEGVAFGVAEMLAMLERAAGPASRVVAVGGGTRGGLWTQVMSDVTGREQQVPVETIGASYGAALLAGIGVGLVPAGTDWAQLGRTVVPDVAAGETYRELSRVFGELYPATREAMHRLAAVGERASAQEACMNSGTAPLFS